MKLVPRLKFPWRKAQNGQKYWNSDCWLTVAHLGFFLMPILWLLVLKFSVWIEFINWRIVYFFLFYYFILLILIFKQLVKYYLSFLFFFFCLFFLTFLGFFLKPSASTLASASFLAFHSSESLSKAFLASAASFSN